GIRARRHGTLRTAVHGRAPLAARPGKVNLPSSKAKALPGGRAGAQAELLARVLVTRLARSRRQGWGIEREAFT
ncbi:hypothetical protein ABZZ47_42325, partial [Streptomyces sp. NPDC006465]|uniref:hypothetical protein n=1 Tax=Streptomyces sp. NPDC006465 TaxID=3157174 RepID=UPI0033B2DE9D